MMHDLGRERLIIAVMCSAYMELAFEQTREYVHQRKGKLSDKNWFKYRPCKQLFNHFSIFFDLSSNDFY